METTTKIPVPATVIDQMRDAIRKNAEQQLAVVDATFTPCVHVSVRARGDSDSTRRQPRTPRDLRGASRAAIAAVWKRLPHEFTTDDVVAAILAYNPHTDRKVIENVRALVYTWSARFGTPRMSKRTTVRESGRAARVFIKNGAIPKLNRRRAGQ